MPTIESKIFIKAPKEKIFALAQDYGLRLTWDPFLKEMKFLDDAKEAAVGVRVWVKAKNNLTMTVKYITLEKPNYVAMKMIEGPFFFSKFSGTWRFKDEDNGTLAIFKYNFEIKFKILTFFISRVTSFILQRDMNARLAGLIWHAENTNILSKLKESFESKIS